MTWTDFDTDTTLERDILLRALPLIPLQSLGDLRATLDTAADKVHAMITASEVIGATQKAVSRSFVSAPCFSAPLGKSSISSSKRLSSRLVSNPT